MYLTICDNDIELQRLHDGSVISRGLQAVRDSIGGFPNETELACSSTIDFPAAHTEDVAVIAFCKALRTPKGHTR